MRISLFASILLTGFTASLLAGESSVGYRSHALTIDEAVQIAIKQNPSILRQVQELKRNKGLVYQAQARLLPQVTASTSYTQQDPGLVSNATGGGRTNIDLLGVQAGQGVLIPLNSLLSSQRSSTESWSVQIQVTQLLYDGGATFASRRAARINEDAAYYTLRDTIDSTVETVRTQFYQILLNKALVQVQEESVNLLQSQLEDQKSRFEAGTVPQFNVLQAQSQLQNQIPLLIASSEQLSDLYGPAGQNSRHSGRAPIFHR